MSALSSEQKRLCSQISANTRWAHHDPREELKPAHDGWRQRFVDEVDPNRELPEAERERRATSAMRAYMARLALQSSKARARKREDRATTHGTRSAYTAGCRCEPCRSANAAYMRGRKAALP